MFADDTKLVASQFEASNRAKLQEDIDRVSEWCKRWHISLITTKCKVMNIGQLNQCADYTIEGASGRKDSLTTTDNEHDLGVEIRRDPTTFNAK